MFIVNILGDTRKNNSEDRLIKSGFSITRLSYWNFFLFIPILFYRKFQKINLKNNLDSNHELTSINPLLDKIFRFILYLENKILKIINFPIGVSIFAICKK